MSKPFDATLKMLLEESPASWPALFDLPTGSATVMDADTSTVSGGADKVIRVAGPPDWILHVDFNPALTRRCRGDCTWTTLCWKTVTACRFRARYCC